MMRKTLSEWMDNCVHPGRVKVHIVVDDEETAEYLSDFDFLHVTKKRSVGVVKPLNALLSEYEPKEDDEIMIVASDDFSAPTNWDMYLEEKFSSFKGVLKVNDGHMEDIISIPILTYKAYCEMGKTIYHPAYDHMFCDKELHDTASELGLMQAVSKADPIWEHHHPHYQKRDSDDNDKRNSQSFSDGKEIYRKRRYLTLQERLERAV
jgi:hypothetical protein